MCMKNIKFSYWKIGHNVHAIKTDPYLLNFSLSSLSLSSLRFRRSWFRFSCLSATILWKQKNILSYIKKISHTKVL